MQYTATTTTITTTTTTTTTAAAATTTATGAATTTATAAATTTTTTNNNSNDNTTTNNNDTNNNARGCSTPRTMARVVRASCEGWRFSGRTGPYYTGTFTFIFRNLIVYRIFTFIVGQILYM